jgi:hypothetical protein
MFEEHGRNILCLLGLSAVYMVFNVVVNKYITTCENPQIANNLKKIAYVKEYLVIIIGLE